MNHFEPIDESHFPLLLKWLQMPHVKKWWDQDVAYTMELVRKKYGSYVKGYKLINGIQKPIQGFIIYNNQNPVGYIQIYNAYDFPRSKPLLGLPEKLGAFDIFIGQKEALQQGLGSKAIVEFFKSHGNQYSYIFADPDSNNVAAIKCYEKSGFKKILEWEDTKEVWMLKELSSRSDSLYNNTTIIYLTGKPGVGKYTIARALAAKHGFIICDNQLINNPIFELLQYDGYAKIPDLAWDTISCIRKEVFNFLAHHTQNSYVLTNCLADSEEDRELYGQVKKMAEARGSLFIPVQLQISKEEHLKRLTRSERRDRWKSIDPSDAEDNGPLISISHPNSVELNITHLKPEEAAEAVMSHIKTVKERGVFLGNDL